MQAFAMKYYLAAAYPDANVSVLDFTCPGNDDGFNPRHYMSRLAASRNPVKAMTKRLLLSARYKKAYERKFVGFEQFVGKYLNVTPIRKAAEQEYDVLLFGSDQIWNPRITAGLQAAYFGDDPRIRGRIKASFAASCGDVSELSAEEFAELRCKANALDYVAVREYSLCERMRQLGIDAIHTIDPTFLLSREEYVRELGISESQEKRYVLEYALQNNQELDQVAAEISRRSDNMPIHKVCGYIDVRERSRSGIYDAGPIEFMTQLANAAYIVTNSFHGVALSIIFRKQFSVVLPCSRQSRLMDLLNDFALTERLCVTGEICQATIDYEQVEKKLEKQMLAAKAYLGRVMGA